jgi:hypothetical protein
LESSLVGESQFLKLHKINQFICSKTKYRKITHPSHCCSLCLIQFYDCRTRRDTLSALPLGSVTASRGLMCEDLKQQLRVLTHCSRELRVLLLDALHNALKHPRVLGHHSAELLHALGVSEQRLQRNSLPTGSGRPEPRATGEASRATGRTEGICGSLLLLLLCKLDICVSFER